jgi:hypothetical protein
MVNVEVGYLRRPSDLVGTGRPGRSRTSEGSALLRRAVYRNQDKVLIVPGRHGRKEVQTRSDNLRQMLLATLISKKPPLFSDTKSTGSKGQQRWAEITRTGCADRFRIYAGSTRETLMPSVCCRSCREGFAMHFTLNLRWRDSSQLLMLEEPADINMSLDSRSLQKTVDRTLCY